MRNLARNLVVAIARAIGSPIRDETSGKVLGRALLVPWRGKVHVIGLEGVARAVFVPQTRLTYWKQEIGFVTHPPPDFPRERGIDDAGPRQAGSAPRSTPL